MELRVNYDKGTPKHADEFEIVIEFMENDADGWQYERFFFKKEKLSDPKFKSELGDFLICTLACVQQDSRGRGGFDRGRDLVKEYYKIPNWGKFAIESFEDYEDYLDDYLEITEKEHDELWDRSSIFKYAVPYYSEGWYTSYHALDVFFYDENGDKFSVDVIL